MDTILAHMIRSHCAAPSTYAETALLAAVDELEARCEPLTEHLVNCVELAIVKALNAGVPWERIDEFRELMREMGESA